MTDRETVRNALAPFLGGSTRLNQATDAILAAIDRSAPAPVVKALEWGEPVHYDVQIISSDKGGISVRAPDGLGFKYEVYSVDGNVTFWAARCGKNLEPEAHFILKAAKAACQADYERRILSALRDGSHKGSAS